MDHLLTSLLEMGFTKNQAEKALQATSFVGIAEAMDWLIDHEQDVDTLGNANENAVEIVRDTANEKVSASVVVSNNGSSLGVQAANGAHSYICGDCDKKFKSVQEVEFHAAKTNHSNFSESTEQIKDLTPEEKKLKLAELQQKIRQKKEQRQAEEKKLAIEVEIARRKQGQGIQASKESTEEKEMKKLVEDRKRQKRDDALAKKKVLDQIKEDREAKKTGVHNVADTLPKTETLKLNDDQLQSSPQNQTTAYNECKIKVRLLDGQTLSHTFGAKEQLSAVRLFIDLNRTDDRNQSYDIAESFPKRVFNTEHMAATLELLGLVPASALILVKKPVINID